MHLSPTKIKNESYNYNVLLKTPHTFFSPSTGKMNNNNNNNNNNNRNKHNYIKDNDYDEDSYEEYESEDDEDYLSADIDLSILNSNFNSYLNEARGTKLNSVGDNGSNNKYLINDKIKKAGGKNGNVFFVNKASMSTTEIYAIKQQIISTPHDILTQSYREKVILDHLKKLMDSNKTCNFIQLKDWYKAKPSYNSTSSEDEDENNERQQQQQRTPTQYMHFVLEYANLDSINKYCKNNSFTMYQMKSLLFQLIYTLAIAQKEFKFQHNDLHLNNILLKSLPFDKKYINYIVNNNNWFIGGGFIVKISDFGLSRIEVPNWQYQKSKVRIIYNKKNEESRQFYPCSDLDYLSKKLNDIKLTKEEGSTNSIDKSLYKDLKKKMCIVAPIQLLKHPFFNSLKICPDDCFQNNSIRISSDGNIPQNWDFNNHINLVSDDDDDDDDKDDDDNDDEDFEDNPPLKIPSPKSTESINYYELYRLNNIENINYGNKYDEVELDLEEEEIEIPLSKLNISNTTTSTTTTTATARPKRKYIKNKQINNDRFINKLFPNGIPTQTTSNTRIKNRL